MSVEENMLDLGLDPMVSKFESQCYGMSEADIRSQYMESITARLSGLEMVVAGILSDAQELMSMDRTESARKQLNVAKFILSSIMESKRA